MKEIPLTQGKVAIVDDDDYERVNKYKWFAWKHRSTFYAVHTLRSTSSNESVTLFMHRFILDAPNAVHVDHADRDGLNNQRENLRFASRSQNGANSKKYKNNTSGFRGVTWDAKSGVWVAQIFVNQRCIRLAKGYDKGALAMIYDNAAREHFGEYARTNF